MADILSNSITGLLSLQQALTTTGHNIANANTPGYSRQSVDLLARAPTYTGDGYLGNGVQVGSITRSFDQYVEAQLRTATSDNSRLSYLQNFANQVNSVLGDTSSGLPQQLQAFFNAAQNVAANPTDLTARSSFIGSAQTLTAQFNRVDGQLRTIDDQIASQTLDIGSEINSYAQQIADLNQRISLAQSQNPNAPPNDLLDQRDQLVEKVAKDINVQVTKDNSGNINLAVGSGQSLVLGSTATHISVGNSFAGVTVSIGNTDITNKVTGGTLGGMIQTQQQLIIPLRNKIGQAAVVLAQEVNANQAAGVDLQGNTPSSPFFTPTSSFSPSVTADPGNKGTGGATAAFGSDLTLLTGATYQARYDGSNWQVTPQPNNGTVYTVASGGTLNLPGMSVTFSGTPQSGDTLNILPTVGAASQIQVVQQDPAGVAAAAAGQGAYSRDNTQMQALIDLGKTTMVGQSATGANDGLSLNDALGSAISQTGSLAAQTAIAAKASASALSNLNAQKQSVSGVNLDEEAAKLMKYQQNYQALSKSIAMTNQLFQSVLNAFG